MTLVTTETIPVAPTETVTPMRLSEALRLGRLTYPTPIIGRSYKGNAACAFGAIWAGLGYGPDQPPLHNWREAAAPQLFSRLAVCPSCKRHGLGTDRVMVSTLIVHLNDGHKWTDDRICAWLDEVEDGAA